MGRKVEPDLAIEWQQLLTELDDEECVWAYQYVMFQKGAYRPARKRFSVVRLWIETHSDIREGPHIIPERRNFQLFPLPAMRRRGDERYRVSFLQRFGDSLKSGSRHDPYTWSGLAGLGLLELTRPHAQAFALHLAQDTDGVFGPLAGLAVLAVFVCGALACGYCAVQSIRIHFGGILARRG